MARGVPRFGSVIERDVRRLDTPEIRRGFADDHRVRALVAPGCWEDTDPFLQLMEDWFTRSVFDQHPHRGIEIVTYVIEGAVAHYDNHGHDGTVQAGDAQWLTAGRGVVHDDQPAGDRVHLLQLWINLPRRHKLAPASYQALARDSLPVRREDGAEVRVFAGESGGARAPARGLLPITMLELEIEPRARLVQALAPDHNGFVVALAGTGAVGRSASPIAAGQVAWLTHRAEPSTVAITAGDDGVRALLFAGPPLREPVAARGPIVMTSEQELNDSYAEYRAQREQFGLP